MDIIVVTAVLMVTILVAGSGGLTCPVIEPCECRTLGFSQTDKAIEMNCRSRNLSRAPDLSPLIGRPLYQVDLSENHINVLENNTFTGLEFVKLQTYPYPRIDISYNPISVIEPGAFQGIIANDISLVLINSTLTSFPESQLSVMRNLSFLHLMDNDIETIRDNSFIHFPKLQAINLSVNKIKELPKHVFRGLENVLEVLYLNEMGIEHFPRESLLRLRRLRRLELDDNKIKHLPGDLFRHFETRSASFSLSIQNNGVTTIDEHAFKRYNFSLYDLNLNTNNITNLQFISKSCGLAFRGDGHIDVHQNPVHCDCDTFKVIKTAYYNVHGRCLAPWNYAGMSFDTTNGRAPERYSTLASYECAHLLVNDSLQVFTCNHRVQSIRSDSAASPVADHQEMTAISVFSLFIVGIVMCMCL